MYDFTIEVRNGRNDCIRIKAHSVLKAYNNIATTILIPPKRDAVPAT